MPASRWAARCLEASVPRDPIPTVLLKGAQGGPLKPWAQKQEITKRQSHAALQTPDALTQACRLGLVALLCHHSRPATAEP